MADTNELDKTIEELEAEVLDELEEANGADAPKKSAGKPDKAESVPSDGATGSTQDTGNPVVDPKQKDAPAKKVTASAKEVSGQKPQKGEGAPDKMDKPKVKDDGTGVKNKSLAAGDELDHDGANLSEKKSLTKEQMKDAIVNGM